MYNVLRRKKILVVFTVTCQEKNGLIGWDFIFLLFFLFFQHFFLHFWLSLCFTSIDFVSKKENKS